MLCAVFVIFDCAEESGFFCVCAVRKLEAPANTEAVTLNLPLGWRRRWRRTIKRYNVDGLRSTRVGLDGKLDALSFKQVLVPIPPDRREMDKHVVAAFALDKTVPFAPAEPLDFAC